MAVYCCSDIHGNIKLFNKIKEFIQPHDTVYFLGDAGDRGPDGYQIIKEIAKDIRFKYIKGNHEDMLVKAGIDFYKYGDTDRDYHLLISNGGYDTFNDMLADPAGETLIYHLRRLPTHLEYINTNRIRCFLSHAGFNPMLDDDNKEIIFPSDYDLMWNRDHYYGCYEYDGNLANSVVIHGHTPIPYLAEDINISQWARNPGPLWYDHHSKVCLDNMSFSTNMIYLLDLDTFEHRTFTSY